MKKLTVLCVVAFVGMLSSAVAVTAAPEGPPGGLNVNVVSPLPLPVTGDVNATVTGDAMNPVPVKGVSEPMQHDLSSEPFVVPTDRLLIIKYVSGHLQMTTGYDILEFYILTGMTENRMTNTFVPVRVGTHNSIDRFAFSQKAYIYAPPGSTVSYGWSTSNPVLYVNHLVISGELVPIP